MDPQAALDELEKACKFGEWEYALSLAEGLRDWLKKGGFMPAVSVGALIELLDMAAIGAEALVNGEKGEVNLKGFFGKEDE